MNFPSVLRPKAAIKAIGSLAAPAVLMHSTVLSQPSAAEAVFPIGTVAHSSISLRVNLKKAFHQNYMVYAGGKTKNEVCDAMSKTMVGDTNLITFLSGTRLSTPVYPVYISGVPKNKPLFCNIYTGQYVPRWRY